MHIRLDEKIALVTGSARGIGQATALALARAGAAVAILDKPDMANQGQETVAAITSLGPKARFYPFDVTDTENIPATVARVIADFGHLDILVNNAGRGEFDSGLECTPVLWNAIIALNLTSLFFFSQAAARHMATRGGGKIVNLGSSHGFVATGSGVSYKASKGAIHSLTRELAYEWIKSGINVNAVAPGPVETPLTRELLMAQGITPEVDSADIASRVPLGRRIRAEEVAAAIVFLCSSEAASIVGHILRVDGGQTIF